MPGICPRCLRDVYFAEEKLALGKVWHCFCFSCRNCRKLLDSWTVATHADDLFCRNCYNRLFSTTSVRPTLPMPVSPILPPIDKTDFVVASCNSVSDCSCYCYCEEDCSFFKGLSQDPVLENSLDCPSEKRRLRGGGGGGGGGEEKELGDDGSFELGDNERSIESQVSQLDHRTSDTRSCHRSSSVGGSTAWYIKHHSVSESTFSNPTSGQPAPPRISSTPNSGEGLGLHQNCNLSCSVHKISDSPHSSSKKLRQHSKQCHYRHHHCHEYEKSNTVRAFQERNNIEKNCRGNNILWNSRDQFRSEARYTAMQNNLNDDCDNVEIVSVEHSAYKDHDNANEKRAPSNDNIDVDVSNDDDLEDIGDWEDDRMRGGCGGGGSGCCCSRGTSLGFDHSTKSSCGRRYRKDRSLTIEGACGCNGRARIGDCGNAVNTGGCCSGEFEEISVLSPRVSGCCSISHDDIHDGACASKTERPPMRHQTCPPCLPDPYSSDPSSPTLRGARVCSPPCSGRKGCCPPAGCTPVRRRIVRCNAPCTGDTQSCGGGGYCGSGCRGGCGKPGQTCLPLTSCTIPPCKARPGSGGLPCMPPRLCAPQPPCCRIPAIPGSSGSMSGTFRRGGAGCYRSGSFGGRTAGGGGWSPSTSCQQQEEVLLLNSCCQTTLPAGCECLGGGQDCQRCGRKVYQAEMQIASGVPYHNICFSCFCCRKLLETLTYHENCGEIYCKQCYVRNFGPQGYGYAGVLQTPM